MVIPYKMAVGLKIPVQLPGELMRGEVIDVLSDDEVMVHLNQQPPLTKTHSYQLGDTVLCTRSQGLGGLDKWEVSKPDGRR